MKIIRITALWCTSCLLMKKIWKKVFKEYNNIQIQDLDIDRDKEQVSLYHPGNTLPILVIFKNGKEVSRIIGEKSKKEMLKIIKELYENN